MSDERPNYINQFDYQSFELVPMLEMIRTQLQAGRAIAAVPNSNGWTLSIPQNRDRQVARKKP